MDPGRDPRPGEGLQPDRHPEAARGRAGVRLGVLARCRRLRPPRPRRRQGARRDRRPAELRRPPRRAHPVGAAAGVEGLRQDPPPGELRALPEQGLRRRPLRLQRHGAARHPPGPAALVPRRAAGRRGARREPGPGLRRRLVPAGAQGEDGGAGRQPDEGLSAKHRHARLDGPGDEAGGLRQARQDVARRSAIRSAFATIGARDRPRRPGRQRQARPRVRVPARPGQARQAGRPRRVAHEPAGAQRLLQRRR